MRRSFTNTRARRKTPTVCASWSAKIVTEFPEIRGYVLLTEGFFYKKWFGAGGQGKEDLRAWIRNGAKAVGIAADEAHKINPKMEILPWEYNVAFSPDQAATKAYVMTQLPESTIPLLTFENGKGFELDGQKGYLRDYAINQVGPAEVTQAQLLEARKRQLPRDLLQGRHVRQLAVRHVSLFALPVPVVCPLQGLGGVEDRRDAGNLELRFQAELGGRDAGLVLPGATRRRWTTCCGRSRGASSARAVKTAVLAAWRHFSEAIQVYPDTGPNWGSCNALAAPLSFRETEAPRDDARPLLVGPAFVEQRVATESVLALCAQPADLLARLHATAATRPRATSASSRCPCFRSI